MAVGFGVKTISPNGNTGDVLTSPDGRTWGAVQIPYAAELFSVVWSDSQFVAVGYGGTILTSSDGGAWITQNSGTAQELDGVAWSGSQFVAVGVTGTILTSP